MNNQPVYFNNGLNKINQIISKKRVRRIFLITGKNSFKNFSQSIFKELKSYQVCIFNNFQINPKVEDLCLGLMNYKKFKPDMIIAIGGGSVIDMAKLIKFFSSQTISFLFM